MADIAAAVADRYASARATGSATRATIAAQGALKRRTSADRSVRPPRRLSAPPRRSAAFAVARARRLAAPSPSDSSGSTTPSCVRHSETSFPTPSSTRSRSWISQATSGGSSSRSAFEHAVRWRSKRAASSGSSRASARVATATVASCSSRCPRRPARRRRSRRTRRRRSCRRHRFVPRRRTRRARRGAPPSGRGAHARVSPRGAPCAPPRAACSRRGRSAWSRGERGVEDVVRARNRRDGTRRRRAARRNTGHGSRLIARSPGVISCRPLVHPVGHDPCTNP